MLTIIVASLVALRVVTTRDSDPTSVDAGSSPSADPAPSQSADPSPPPQRVQESGPPLPELPKEVCVRRDRKATLRVVTYNIKSARFGGQLRLSDIARELATMDADVVLLQEVDRGRVISGRIDTPALLGEALDYRASFGSNVRFPTGEYGTAILSRFPILQEQNVLLPNRPGMQQRGLLGATIRVRGIPVNVYNTHLQHTSRPMRVVQMQTIVRLLAEDPLPGVLGGDLNDIPASPVMRVAYQVFDDTWTAVGVGPGHTVPAHKPRARIDYLLHQQGDDPDTTIKPLSAQVLGVGSSDHRGVLATYRLKAEADPICVPAA